MLSSKFGRYSAWVTALIGVCSLLLTIGVSSASAAAATLSLTSDVTINGSSNASRPTIPAGAPGANWVINYTCSNQSCINTIIELAIPTTLRLGSPSYSASDVSRVATVGSTMRFTLVSPLPAGASGQIELPILTTEWTTPDNTAFTLDAKISSDNANTVVTPAVSGTILAANRTSAAATQTAGGSLDSITRYSAGTCIGTSGDATKGPLSVAGGSTLVAVLPTGATFESAGSGGGYTAAAGANPATVNWVFPGTIGGYSACYPTELVLRYNSVNGNAAHDSRTVTITWTGHSIGETRDRELGRDSIITILTVPTPGATIAKTANPAEVAVSQTSSLLYTANNSGTSAWTAVELTDAVAPQLKVTNIQMQNPAQTAASLLITTRFGSDGAPGTADDAREFEIARGLAPGSQASANPYGSFPNGHAPLPAGDSIVSVHYRSGAVDPGAGGELISLNVEVLATDRNGTAVSGGDQIGTTATFLLTTLPYPLLRMSTAPISVRNQTPTVATRLFGPGTLGSGVRRGTFNASASALGFPWRDPILVLLADAGVNLDTASITTTGGSNSFAGRSVTTYPNWQGTGSTLYRFTFSANTSLPPGASYNFSIDADLSPTAYGSLGVALFTASAREAILLDSNYFGSGPDTDNKSGDGRIGDVLGKWGATISPARSVSAALTQSVRGFWDTDFAVGPATGNSRPGAQDRYQISLKNTGSVELDGGTIINILPRPGDLAVLSSAARNPTTSTFPVFLAGTPQYPTLSTPVTMSYSTAVNPCRVEFAYTPTGCAAPAWTDWAAIPPSALSSVSALKFEFGANILKPGISWTVQMAVTTPVAGATEPDFAIANPVVNSPSTDEVAYNSSGFRIKEAAVSSFLSASEAPRVGLAMPSLAGPAGAAPTATALQSTGVAPNDQAVTVILPVGGSNTLLSSLGVTSNVVDIPGVGSYFVNGGTITFHPDAGYLGTPTAVRYRLTDAFNQTGESTYAPTVTAPPGPSAAPLPLGGGTGTDPQLRTISAGPTDTFTFLDAAGMPTLLETVAHQGSYRYDPIGKIVRFEPFLGFSGPTAPVRYRLTDRYGQFAESVITSTVALPAPPLGTSVSSTGVAGLAQTVVVAIAAGTTLTLLDEFGSATTSRSIAGQGVYVLEPSSGRITFTPVAGFFGAPTPASLVVVDAYGQRSAAQFYQPTVLNLPMSAIAPPAATTPLHPAIFSALPRLPMTGASDSEPIMAGGLLAFGIGALIIALARNRRKRYSAIRGFMR